MAESETRKNLIWYGLGVSGLVLFLNAIALVALSIAALFSGETTLIWAAIIIFLFGVLPSVGLGLWLWDEAKSHGAGNRY